MREPHGLPAGAAQTQKKARIAMQGMKHEKEAAVPSNELGSADTVTEQKEQPAEEMREENLYRSIGGLEGRNRIKSLATHDDDPRDCEIYLSVSDNPSAMETPVDR